MNAEVTHDVLGCVDCGKPSALVGDALPRDGLCPWCRGSASPDAPAVARLYREDQAEFALTSEGLDR